jgi:hypothetical protein
MKHPTKYAGICFKYVSFHVSEVENAFPPHVKQQIEDRKVWQKAMFLLVNLIIRLHFKIGILSRMFGIDGFTIVMSISC